MEEETKRKRIYETGHEKLKNSIDAIKKQPLSIQRLMFFNMGLGLQYTYHEIYEDSEKIVVTSTTKTLSFGNNGVFERMRNNHGITFLKKGRSTARLNIWYKARVQEVSSLVSVLFEYLNNVKGLEIFLSNFVQRNRLNLTKGLLSAMLVGTIDTPEQCAKYCATYSLRGVKIDSKYKTTALLNFLEKMSDYYTANMILRSSYDVNKVLSYFDPVFGDIAKARQVVREAKESRHYRDSILGLNHKVCWGSSTDSLDGPGHPLLTLNTKVNKLCNLVRLFDAGPTFNLPFAQPIDFTNETSVGNIIMTQGVSNDLPF